MNMPLSIHIRASGKCSEPSALTAEELKRALNAINDMVHFADVEVHVNLSSKAMENQDLVGRPSL